MNELARETRIKGPIPTQRHREVLDGDIFTFGESTLHQTHHNDVVRSRGQRIGDDHGYQCGKNFEGEQKSQERLWHETGPPGFAGSKPLRR